MTDQPIAYLVNSKHVRCLTCTSLYRARAGVARAGVPLYRENLGRYSQRCHECRTEIVTPATGWCELFARDACGRCLASTFPNRDYDPPCEVCSVKAPHTHI